jgi:hypothetical protein
MIGLRAGIATTTLQQAWLPYIFVRHKLHIIWALITMFWDVKLSLLLP